MRDAYGTEWRRRAGVADLVEHTASRFPTLDPNASCAGVGADRQPTFPPVDAAATAAADEAVAAQAKVDVAGAVRFARWILVVEVGWMLTFAAGGVLAVWTNSQNGSSQVSCLTQTTLVPFSTSLPPISCGHHGYVLPIVLIAVGWLGFLVTALIASTWAAKRYGVGIVAGMRLRRGRYGAAGRGQGVAQPPMSWPGGVPPGTPGSPGF